MAPPRTVVCVALLGLAAASRQFGLSGSYGVPQSHSRYSPPRPQSGYGPPQPYGSYSGPHLSSGYTGPQVHPGGGSSFPQVHPGGGFQVHPGGGFQVHPGGGSTGGFPSKPQPGKPHKPVVPGGQGDRFYFSWEHRRHQGGKYTWQQAHRECQQLGLQLVSLNSARKERIITARLSGAPFPIAYYWTSGNRHRSQQFVWADGRPVCGPGQHGCYSNWSRTGFFGLPQPDNREGNEFCMAVLNNFYEGEGIVWHDIACHHEKHFVCEGRA